ncbi:hypothetical protein BD779DRAFT_1672387 [Infundibulicybe gibba]|nr:hypothetical protein BD779DRAFT_1672387 [Infundibulicybe gibba]
MSRQTMQRRCRHCDFSGNDHPTPTRSVAPAVGSNTGGGSKSFFQNTGAVAGTFTVVGLVAIGLLIALVVALLRRRRNRKLDREIAEAEAEAAMAPAPVFLDDENDVYGPGAGGGYSDVSSHGTYGQPPMSVGHGMGGQEAYGMRELGPGPGEIYNPAGYGAGAAAGAGAAGIGVARARSTRDGGYAAGLQDGAAPYAAFSLPHQDMYNNSGGPQYANMPVPPPNTFRGPGSPEFDLLEAAGMGTSAMGAGMAAGMARNASGQHSPPGDLVRNTSQESYAAHYQPGFNYQSQPPDDNSDAYGGFVPDNQHRSQGGSGPPGRSVSPPGLPNPFGSTGSRGHEYHDGDDESSDEEEVPSRRVLKVANE